MPKWIAISKEMVVWLEATASATEMTAEQDLLTAARDMDGSLTNECIKARG